VAKTGHTAPDFKICTLPPAFLGSRWLVFATYINPIRRLWIFAWRKTATQCQRFRRSDETKHLLAPVGRFLTGLFVNSRVFAFYSTLFLGGPALNLSPIQSTKT
jgi:hypothetical protein